LRGHLVTVVDRTTSQTVHVDPRLVSTALAHILENAAQYSPEGSTITVTHEVKSDGLDIAVDDEGPGIAPADRPQLFERFYRGSEARRHTSGTGMGLSIVEGLLTAQGGRVWADASPPRGARFHLFIPTPSRVGPDE
jgi:two-component system sensor histidine kinase KdpD